LKQASGSASPVDWSNSSILVTGGTGSFGQRFVQHVLEKYKPRRLAVLSRDELKQGEMKQQYPGDFDGPVRFLLGDVRDYDRLRRAFHDVDIVIHAAALKQVPAAEADPFEAVMTNIMGAKNVIDAAIDTGVSKVLALSTDKAVGPANLYGGTKFVAEKLFVQGNAYSTSNTIFACSRYGNVVGSRGSVIPLFKNQRLNGSITITDPRMTRFWITLDQGVDFVMKSVEMMSGGEIFVPKLPVMKILDLANAIAPDAEVKFTGIRPGEKIHEEMVSISEARTTFEYDDFYCIMPAYHSWQTEPPTGGKKTDDDFVYSSETSTESVSSEFLQQLVEQG
jgi:UDP-N-acetylglucosamine 4,6-dehydratase/5-epimerase